MSAEKFHIPWEDIIFEKGQIRIRSGKNTKGIIFKTYKNTFTEQTIRASLEHIKKFFPNQDPQKFYVVNREIQSDSPFFQELDTMIEFASITGKYSLPDYQVIQGIKKEKPFQNFNKLSIHEQIAFLQKNIRSEYISKLLPWQKRDKKIIMIEENNGALHEECFIFTIEDNKKNHVLVWESTVISRATHLFFAATDTERKLKNYILTAGGHKRQRLWDNNDSAKKIKSDLNYLGIVEHESPRTFLMEVSKVINESFSN